MTSEQAKTHIKNQLEPYLNSITTRKGRQYICPLCKSGTGRNKTPAGSVRDNSFHCFSCGFHGDVIDLIGEIECIADKKDRFNRAYEIFGVTVDGENRDIKKKQVEEKQKQVEEKQQDYTSYFLKANKALHKNPEALQYIASRGISAETADRFMIGYDKSWRSPAALGAGKNPPPSCRLIIPTSKQSYLARATDKNTNPAYKAIKQGAVSLFNAVVLQEETPVFIVEGELDALSVIEAGGQAVGLGSVNNTGRFIEMCKTTQKVAPLILCLDNDEPGRKAQAELKTGLETLKIAVLERNIAEGYKDPNEHLKTDPEAFRRAIQRAEEAAIAQKNAMKEAEIEAYRKTNTASYIQSFMNGIVDSVNTPYIPTGFSDLDEVLDGGLYEGLYIIGAITSLGKTTFALQISDQIAQNGDDVLMFSLEMARTELMSKSISRETFLISPNTADAKTSRGITTGKRYPGYRECEKVLIKQAISEYAKYAQNIYIIEGLGDVGVFAIRETVKQHISITGKTPVVLVDYLQILAPYDPRATDKQNTDKAVLELKRISRDYKIPVIAISSFNRQNYSQPVTMEAFKESGAIEYSSDVLIGLQAKGAGTSGFNIDEAKRKDPREIELKLLKNRNGATGGVIQYSYYPLFNCFKGA